MESKTNSTNRKTPSREDSDFDAVVTTPSFSLGIRCEGIDVVSEIVFLPPQNEVPAHAPLALETARQLRCWLKDPKFSFGLPLKPTGTSFQRHVWDEISIVPCGQTRTYGEVAKRLKSAPRAVGQACGANRLPIVIPCHRIISTGGGLGGFNRQGGGFLLDVKRWLLAHEQQ